jgi:AcrR family transcriptional regulator
MSDVLPSSLSVEDRIIEAASQCIAEKGAKACTMENFAKAAQLGRKTVYRAFSNRLDLLDSVVMRRYQIMLDELSAITDTASSFAQLCEESIVKTTNLLHGDPIIRSVFEAGSHTNFSHYLMDADSLFQVHVVDFFKSYIEQARISGELIPGMNDEEVVAWIRSGQMLIMLKPNFDEASQRDFIQRFILPAIIQKA